jgi:hypothetical protein
MSFKYLAVAALFLILSSVVVFLPDESLAQRKGAIPYSEATFEVAEDPAKVVLQIVTYGGLSGRSNSTTVYGDGQVELQKSLKGAVIEKHEIFIDHDAVRELLTVVVHHGVAEWHTETIHAWMRQQHPNLPNIEDGVRVRISLNLERYQRGDHQAAPLSLSFGTKAPGDLAELYPEILQFRGVRDLVRWSSERWGEAATQASGD